MTNAGVLTGGIGGTLTATPGAVETNTFSSNGGNGVGFLGGTLTNTQTGVVTGGIGGAGFGGTATEPPNNSGFGGHGILFSAAGAITNKGQITGGAGASGTVPAGGSRPANDLGGFNPFDGGIGGGGILALGSPARSIVNNSTGVIRGGRGGDGSNGMIDLTSPRPLAGAGGEGGFGIAISSGSILNFGQIFGGAAGSGANATTAGQVGGGASSFTGLLPAATALA